MRFHVLGLGPIGSLLSHHLRRAIPPSHSITLIHKTTRQAQEALANGGVIHVENNGLVTTATGFKSEIFEPSYANHLPQGGRDGASNDRAEEEAETIESLFITTKAHQTLSAVHRLLPRLSRNTTIVLLQNGMGVYEELVHEVFRNPEQRPHFILASNTHGAFLKGFYKVVHAGVGGIDFGIVPDPGGRNFEAGFLDENVPKSERKPHLEDVTKHSEDPVFVRYRSLRNTVAAMLLMESLDTTWKPMAQIQLTMRRKLVVNAVINPLTAVMGCRNGEIFSTNASYRIMQRVCQEAADVYAAQIRAETQAWLSALASQGEDMEKVAVGRLPRALTRGRLEEECLRVAQVTKGNISSMLSDVRRGRKTEIEFINGYLLKLGSTYHVEMPATATLLNLVKMRSAIPLDQMF
jgi:2-dehydropantoate 2-reductase